MTQPTRNYMDALAHQEHETVQQDTRPERSPNQRPHGEVRFFVAFQDELGIESDRVDLAQPGFCAYFQLFYSFRWRRHRSSPHSINPLRVGCIAGVVPAERP